VSFAGLDQCACKRGFFTLRDCGKAASTTCSVCTRRVCDEHLAPRVQAQVCIECAAKQEEEGAVQPRVEGAEEPLHEFPTSAAVRYRTRWYRSRDYSPMWWATPDPYWNDIGYRWYGDNDDDDRGGFGDS
jgi:hypothetical protein